MSNIIPVMSTIDCARRDYLTAMEYREYIANGNNVMLVLPRGIKVRIDLTIDNVELKGVWAMVMRTKVTPIKSRPFQSMVEVTLCDHHMNRYFFGTVETRLHVPLTAIREVESMDSFERMPDTLVVTELNVYLDETQDKYLICRKRLDFESNSWVLDKSFQISDTTDCALDLQDDLRILQTEEDRRNVQFVPLKRIKQH